MTNVIPEKEAQQIEREAETGGIADKGISKFSSYSKKVSGMALVGGGAYLVAILF